jgi:hypothetical protein
MEFQDFDLETFEFVSWPTELQIWRKAAMGATADMMSSKQDDKIKPAVESFLGELQGIHSEEQWRSSYRKIVEEFTRLHAMVNNEQALDMAQAGLDAVHSSLRFRLDAQTDVPAKDVFILTKSFTPLQTKTKMGTKAPDLDFQFGLADPTNPTCQETLLYNMDAVAQIDAIYNYGSMETSASVLAKTTVTTTNLPSILNKKKFVLLGCTSELGPAKSLLQIPGVTVLGVARGGKRLDDLIEFATYHAPDDTTFLYPASQLYPNGGADLLLQGPAIAQWILNETDANQDELVIVPLASDHGEANIRLAAAMDLIVQRVMRQRCQSNTILWNYTSPTTCMVLPPTAASTAKKYRNERPTYERWANTLTMGKWLEPGLEPDPNNHDYAILNGIVSAQGPEYVLAKTIQIWRCMVAQYRDHDRVSAPFCPLSRTKSMITDDSIANALEGMMHFAPMLAFDVLPASTLMAAILIAHLQLLNRQVPDLDESPFSMFWDGACHGGIWFAPYTMESVSVVTYALGKSTYYPKGYFPPQALPPPRPDGEDLEPSEKRKIDPNILLTLTDSETGEPMPESVRERLDFL